MRLPYRVLPCLAAASCLNQPTFVSITPDHGYEDGCIDVVLQGHHLGTKAKGAVGGTDFLYIEAHEDEKGTPEQATDEGFVYYAGVPGGDQGWADVEMVVDGEKKVLKDGFYYEACPGGMHVDYIDTTSATAVGDAILIIGCGLSDSVSVDFYAYDDGTTTGTTTGTTGTTTGTGPLPVANVPLLPDCSTAQVHAEVPTLPDGTYQLVVVHDDGTTYAGPCYSDSGDTGYTCEPLVVTVGGAK